MSASEFARSAVEEQVERRFRLLAEAMPQVVWTARPDGQRDYVNGRWSEYSGLSAVESLGSGWMEAIHPDDLDLHHREVSAALRERRVFELEYRLRRRDGVFRWFLSRAEPIVDDGGNVARWCGTCTDIDDRKTATDRRLREDNERLRLAAQAARMGYWEWDIPGDRITWSDSLEQLSGTSPERFGATLEGFLRLVHPGDRGRVETAVRRAVSDGGPYELELRLLNTDGTYRCALTKGRVYHDPRGRPVRMSGIEVDITARRQAEEALLESEEFARRLADVAPSILYVYDLEERRNVWGNREMTAILGYDREQIDALAGDLLGRLLHPEDLDRYRGHADRLLGLADGEVAEFEYRMRHADGSWRWLQSRDMVFRRDGHGRVKQIVGAAQDITDRRDAEEELRASEHLFRATFDNAAVGIAHVAPDGQWLRVNDRLCTILGYSREELLALTFSDITHPGDIEADWAQARRLLAGEADTYSLEKRYIRRDGRVVWANLTVSLIRTDAGEPDFFISVVEDVSARRQAETEVARLNAERHASLQELRTILETAPVGINVARDPSCKVIGGNPALAEMLGMSAGENVSKSRDDAESLPYRILRDGVDAAAETLPMQRAAATGLPVGDELYEIARADGSRIQVLVRANPILDESGAVAGAVGICVDVSALKRAEVALREADRRKDEFLATLAHELRNPLAAITMAHALARNEKTPAESMRWAIDVIDRQLRQLGRLIDDLMDVSRIARGKVRLAFEPVDLRAIVARAVESVGGPIADRGHELKLAVASEPMPLRADPARLEQVLTNLLNNAAKYTDPGGRIELSAAPDGAEAVVRVRDNGIGIAPAMLAKVFDLFSQVDESVGRSQGGLGIGLTLVRSLTEMHGGTVSVASEGPGLGSEFTVRVPLLALPVAAGSTSPSQPATAIPAAGEARRILVVDDNVDAAASLSLLLACHGHTTRTANDGPRAIEAAKAFAPEIVILDIGLPVMSGLEVAAALRREVGEAVVLIALSGYAQERDRRRSREAGFDDHLAKPVDLERLLALIEAGAASG